MCGDAAAFGETSGLRPEDRADATAFGVASFRGIGDPGDTAAPSMVDLRTHRRRQAASPGDAGSEDASPGDGGSEDAMSPGDAISAVAAVVGDGDSRGREHPFCLIGGEAFDGVAAAFEDAAAFDGVAAFDDMAAAFDAVAFGGVAFAPVMWPPPAASPSPAWVEPPADVACVIDASTCDLLDAASDRAAIPD